MDGWSLVDAGTCHQHGTITQQINYAAVNRGLSYESEVRTAACRSTLRRWPSVTPPRVCGHHEVQRRVGEPAWGDREPVARNPAITLLPTRRSASRMAISSMRCSMLGERSANYGFLVNNIGSIARRPCRSPIRSLPASYRSRPSTPPGPAHGRLFPRLRPELSGPLALQGVETGVRSVRHQSQSAQPVAGSDQPRPHGQFRNALGGGETHLKTQAGRLRPRRSG